MLLSPESVKELKHFGNILYLHSLPDQGLSFMAVINISSCYNNAANAHLLSPVVYCIDTRRHTTSTDDVADFIQLP